jgi:hypothetical protein
MATQQASLPRLAPGPLVGSHDRKFLIRLVLRTGEILKESRRGAVH